MQPGDDIVFVRKDLADQDGVDSNSAIGVGNSGFSYGDGASNAHSCAQATSGALPTGQTDVPPDGSANEFGGTVAAECKDPPTQAGCDPATCQVWPQNANYHVDCRYLTEAKLPGIQDTIDPNRHYWLNPPPSAVAPAAPPWHDDIDDTPGDNGGNSNALVAGTGQTDETYDESGTYYVCYKQSRDATLPGYNFYQCARPLAPRNWASADPSCRSPC